ncbi:MAG: acyltransferase family protein [Dysgonomonas sp.]
MAAPKKDTNNTRLFSLDALRGFDMLFIMGLAPLMVAITKFAPESNAMGFLAKQMHHVSWNGFAHHDTIFPLFLFIAGISFPYSLEKQRSMGKSNKEIQYKIIKRGIVLVLLGFVCNGILKLDFENMRYTSVLGRIGIAWMFAALFFTNFKLNVNITISFLILLGYWLLLWLVPDSTTPYSYEDNLVGVVDRAILPGRLYEDNFFDPEGILSTLPAIATALLGMFTGVFVKTSKEIVSDNKKALYMLLAAVVFLVIGLVWNTVFPINKKLWTSSFVCVAASYSLFMFALFYYIIDVKGYSRWAFFLRVVGLNSITIYVAQRIIGFKQISNFFLEGVANLSPTNIGELITRIGYITVCWLFLYFLYQKNIFLKV